MQTQNQPQLASQPSLEPLLDEEDELQPLPEVSPEAMPEAAPQPEPESPKSEAVQAFDQDQAALVMELMKTGPKVLGAFKIGNMTYKIETYYEASKGICYRVGALEKSQAADVAAFMSERDYAHLDKVTTIELMQFPMLTQLIDRSGGDNKINFFVLDKQKFAEQEVLRGMANANTVSIPLEGQDSGAEISYMVMRDVANVRRAWLVLFPFKISSGETIVDNKQQYTETVDNGDRDLHRFVAQQLTELVQKEHDNPKQGKKYTKAMQAYLSKRKNRQQFLREVALELRGHGHGASKKEELDVHREYLNHASMDELKDICGLMYTAAIQDKSIKAYEDRVRTLQQPEIPVSAPEMAATGSGGLVDALRLKLMKQRLAKPSPAIDSTEITPLQQQRAVQKESLANYDNSRVVDAMSAQLRSKPDPKLNVVPDLLEASAVLSTEASVQPITESKQVGEMQVDAAPEKEPKTMTGADTVQEQRSSAELEHDLAKLLTSDKIENIEWITDVMTKLLKYPNKGVDRSQPPDSPEQLAAKLHCIQQHNAQGEVSLAQLAIDAEEFIKNKVEGHASMPFALKWYIDERYMKLYVLDYQLMREREIASEPQFEQVDDKLLPIDYKKDRSKTHKELLNWWDADWIKEMDGAAVWANSLSQRVSSTSHSEGETNWFIQNGSKSVFEADTHNNLFILDMQSEEFLKNLQDHQDYQHEQSLGKQMTVEAVLCDSCNGAIRLNSRYCMLEKPNENQVFHYFFIIKKEDGSNCAANVSLTLEHGKVVYNKVNSMGEGYIDPSRVANPELFFTSDAALRDLDREDLKTQKDVLLTKQEIQLIDNDNNLDATQREELRHNYLTRDTSNQVCIKVQDLLSEHGVSVTRHKSKKKAQTQMAFSHAVGNLGASYQLVPVREDESIAILDLKDGETKPFYFVKESTGASKDFEIFTVWLNRDGPIVRVCEGLQDLDNMMFVFGKNNGKIYTKNRLNKTFWDRFSR